MAALERCATCHQKFHGNCRPMICTDCNSKTHRKCVPGKLNLDVEFLCIRCTQKVRVEREYKPTVLPSGRAIIPSEDSDIRREMNILSGGAVPAPLHVSTDASVDPQRSESTLINDDTQESSDDENPSASVSDVSVSSSGSTTIEISQSGEIDQVVNDSALKSLISGIRANFLTFSIVMVVLLTMFLAFLSLFVLTNVGQALIRRSDLKTFIQSQQNSDIVYEKIGFVSGGGESSVTHSTGSSSSIPSVTTENFDVRTGSSGTINQMVTLTEFSCSPTLDTVLVCVNESFRLCVIIHGKIPSGPTKIIPAVLDSDVIGRIGNLCVGKTIHQVSDF